MDIKNFIAQSSNEELQAIEEIIKKQYIINSMNTSKEIIDNFEWSVESEHKKKIITQLESYIPPVGLFYWDNYKLTYIKKRILMHMLDYDCSIKSIFFNLSEMIYIWMQYDDGTDMNCEIQKDVIKFSDNFWKKSGVLNYTDSIIQFYQNKVLLDAMEDFNKITIKKLPLTPCNWYISAKLSLGIYFDNEDPKLCVAIDDAEHYHATIFDKVVKDLPNASSWRIIWWWHLSVDAKKPDIVKYHWKSDTYGPIPLEYYNIIKHSLNECFNWYTIELPSINNPKYII